MVEQQLLFSNNVPRQECSENSQPVHPRSTKKTRRSLSSDSPEELQRKREMRELNRLQKKASRDRRRRACKSEDSSPSSLICASPRTPLGQQSEDQESRLQTNSFTDGEVLADQKAEAVAANSCIVIDREENPRPIRLPPIRVLLKHEPESPSRPESADVEDVGPKSHAPRPWASMKPRFSEPGPGEMIKLPKPNRVARVRIRPELVSLKNIKRVHETRSVPDTGQLPSLRLFGSMLTV